MSQLAQLIVNAGGIASVIDYIGESRGNVRLPGIMMLGYVGAHSENLAMAVIVSKVCIYKWLCKIICKFLKYDWWGYLSNSRWCGNVITKKENIVHFK